MKSQDSGVTNLEISAKYRIKAVSGQVLQLQMAILVDCFDGGTPHEQDHGQKMQQNGAI